MSRKINAFTKFSTVVAEYSGRPVTFALAVAAVVLWGATGPLFGFSETWQLVVNTGTTIITFLMVFVLQNSQNRDATAVQAKLDELILTSSAENEYIGIEELEEQELKRITEILKEYAQNEEDRALHEKILRAVERQPTGRA
ncbi:MULTISPECIES: low affinity iron permease family protein [unclassified Sinorhizobium]|uniref:low affinity iron permease family protein n=1 Tax=unclassified Sinorhizobium TaxID=2613772 RepID=UPI0024C3BF86|nr:MULTISPECIES: low affinity iron permease family protein [unclassified Sinorhizobium]MDK1374394.1 low affinity iron permease family protein [Sinorhizobium sp. 6-70]MDK1478953.1 low affinity iron permease family protein [Sinorhizobium sp. 6-117]